MFKHISIVDDDSQITQFISNLVQRWGYPSKQYTNIPRFLATAHNQDDLIILDLCMPELDGVEVIRELARKKCRSSLILMTGQNERILNAAQLLCKEYQLQCLGGFTKPIKVINLRELLDDFYQIRTPTVRQPDLVWLPNKHDLQQALDNKELLLHFQPQINIKTGLVDRVEALVRWLHPEHGLIYPDHFIALAEQENMINRLTEQVIEMAIMVGKNWWENGNSMKISVNISARNICNHAFPEYLSRLFHDNELSPSLISLEITKSQLMEQWGTSLDTLTRLRIKGFSLSIDDFGTGFSSFSNLHDIPFSEIKVDKSFVMNMTQDPTARAIVESCIMLSHKLNMTCVAEGVESQQHLNILADMGCDMAQGYYFAQPMPVKEVLAWICPHNNWMNCQIKEQNYG